MRSVDKTLSNLHEGALKELVKRLRTELDDKLHSIILYGSVARGEATRESDIDILVVIEDTTLSDKISEISFDIDLKNGVLTSIVEKAPEMLDRNVERGSPFMENVAEEAVILYDDGTFERVRKRLIEARRRIAAGG